MKFPFGIQKRKSELTDTTELMYRVGQVWSYRTRPQEEGSTLTVVKVESHPTYGNIIHIHIANLNMDSSSPGATPHTVIQHVPVDENSLDSSDLRLIKTVDALPDFREGYSQWRQAFDAGKAGAFSLPVDEIVSIIEETLNQ